jgi:hypothetical protein
MFRLRGRAVSFPSVSSDKVMTIRIGRGRPVTLTQAEVEEYEAASEERLRRSLQGETFDLESCKTRV